MTHPLVEQLYFARSEFTRCMAGVSAEDGARRVLPMNSLSWIVGHMAVQESAYWVLLARGKKLYPELRELVGTGSPASTPPLEEMWAAWREVTAAADEFLETITPEILVSTFLWKGEPYRESVGTMLYRNLYHYWFHTGEAHGIRQALGHINLPDFIGNIGGKAPYRAE